MERGFDSVFPYAVSVVGHTCNMGWSREHPTSTVSDVVTAFWTAHLESSFSCILVGILGVTGCLRGLSEIVRVVYPTKHR